jgi:hypothetical protein
MNSRSKLFKQEWIGVLEWSTNIFLTALFSGFAYFIILRVMHCRYKCSVTKTTALQTSHCTDSEIICFYPTFLKKGK